MSARKRQRTDQSAGRSQRATAFPPREHDHERCIDAALGRAADVCAERGARFTSLRRRVLEIVWRSHRPLGAYDILQTLAGEGRSAAPPTVYRALDFLRGQGLVHRIESLNAYVGCAEPGHGARSQFLICQACGWAAELNDARLEHAISRSVASLGFKPARQTIEIAGLCPNCVIGDW